MAFSGLVTKGTAVIGSQNFEDMQAETVWNEYGVCSKTVYFNGPYDSLDSHVGESLGYLKLKSAKKTRGEAGMGVIAITYEGIPPQSGGGDSKDPQKSYSAPRYSCRIVTSTSKIQCHPDFRSKIGGSPGKTKNWAQFDEKDGSFKGFTDWSIGNDGLPTQVYNPKIGITSYEEVGLIWEETKIHTTSDSISASDLEGISGVGKIWRNGSSPPGLEKFFGSSVGGRRNWLFLSAEIEQIGFGYKVTRKWRLSGIRGWDVDIYGPNSGTN